MNFDDHDLDRMLGFIVSIDSPFYPQIGTLYERRIEAWARARRAELHLDEVDEEDLESASTIDSSTRRE